MPTQQLVYEGTDLQALIKQVVDEHGPARIRPPERQRKGGVFGFFTREVYVISVDPEATDRASRDREPTTESLPTERQRPPSRARTAQPSLGRPSPGPGQPVGPGSLEDLIDATEDDLDLGTSRAAATLLERPGRPAGGSAGERSDRPRTVKPFSQVLSEVASSLGEEPGTYRVEPGRIRRISPLVPRPARPVGAPTAKLASMIDHPAGSGGVVTAPATPPAPSWPNTPRPVVPIRMRSARAGVTAPAPAPAPAPAKVAALPPAPATARPAPRVAAPAAPPAARSVSERPGLGAAVVDLLLAAGFPEALLPAAGTGRPAPATLEEAFARLREAPPLPTAAGGLVAVVGDARLVRPLVRSVATQVGCPADEVAVAAPSAGAGHATPGYRVRTPEQAATLARGWRRDRVGVVAVYAPPLGSAQDWTRQMLRAMRPTCVWSTASATTKPDDVRRWVGAIGGADALAVSDAAATASPAAILSAGVPVARLDNEMATPERWAALVADLLTRR